MLCCKDRQPLLLRCLSLFLSYKGRLGTASESIYGPHMVNHTSFLPNIRSIVLKITNFRHRISPGNMSLCHKDMSSLLLECFQPFLRCITMIVSASDSICVRSPHCPHRLLSNTYTLHCSANLPNLGPKIGPGNVVLCCKDIHELLHKEVFVIFP